MVKFVGDGGNDLFHGGDGRDNARGRAGDDSLFGGGGADVLDGGKGNDRLYGEAGADQLHGGAGGDRLDGGGSDQGFDALYGDAGDDSLSVYSGDYADGGEGTDSLTYFGSFDTVAVHGDFRPLDAGQAANLSDGTVVSSVEALEIWLGSGDNRLRLGDNQSYFVQGHEGDDTVIGGRGDDFIAGSTGVDLLIGGGGDDELFGMSNDQVFGGGGDDLLHGALGDTLTGGDGWDSVTLSAEHVGFDISIDFKILQNGSREFLDGTTLVEIEGGQLSLGNGDDVIVGSRLDLTITGGGGDDRLSGSRSGDLLGGGEGVDTVSGGLGDDTIVTGIGDDRLSGGDGSDLYLFRSLLDQPFDAIVITDLDDEDVIDLTGLPGAPYELVDSFSGQAGEAILRYASGQTSLRIDLDGDAAADLRITMMGDHRDFPNFVF